MIDLGTGTVTSFSDARKFDPQGGHSAQIRHAYRRNQPTPQIIEQAWLLLPHEIEAGRLQIQATKSSDRDEIESDFSTRSPECNFWHGPALPIELRILNVSRGECRLYLLQLSRRTFRHTRSNMGKAPTFQRLCSLVPRCFAWTMQVGIPPMLTYAVLLYGLGLVVFLAFQFLPFRGEVSAAITLLTLMSAFIPIFVWLMVVQLHRASNFADRLASSNQPPVPDDTFIDRA